MRKSPDIPPDMEIIQQVVGGDSDSFEVLVDCYKGLVFSIAARHVPADSVEDIAQDAFLEAFRSLGSYNGEGAFSHWLYKISVRCCYAYWRSKKASLEIPLNSISPEIEEWMESVLNAESVEAFQREAERDEASRVLEFGLSRLSAEDRMVLTLVHLEGHTVSEASKLLGWSVISVKVRAHRSRSKLRKIIQNLLDGIQVSS